ncbi:BNR repeat-containing family member [Nonomuraea solani]|uniref:BNR repeat-containing family member n=1 Tax=Nonomuraea solani TaxID=1144553 RepID=A0A1H5VKV0_9ACTN|nr:BNR repeat-containing protein [Nonomuraea solani]SEF87952.1 BNR repeat-containing family member [Nonomuraea solani]
MTFLRVIIATATAAALTAHPQPAAAPSVQVLRNTLVDPRAIYFVSYDGLVNQATFQQDGILTHAGHQYTAWYTADRSAMIARRTYNGTAQPGPWQTLKLPHRLTADDSHNVISLGVSRQDGRLHIAMDTHNTAVHYVKSAPGLVNAATWSLAQFGPVQRTLDGVGLGDITYPQFLATPEGRLQLSYRTGGSGNGTNELAEYDNGTWTRLGRWQSATGTYTTAHGGSTTRNMYLHGLDYGPSGRLHAAYTWREGNFGVICAPGGISNHDTGYVYSDDRGRTWKTANDATAAVTGTGTQVSINTPNQVVDPLNPDHALMNQEAQAVDSQGRPHVLISYVPGRFTQCVTDFVAGRRANARNFHLRRLADGTWRKVEVPVPLQAFGRSRLVLDARDNAYVIMPGGRIVAASAAAGWSDWTLRYDAAGLNAFGEIVVDDSAARTTGVISLAYQERSSGTTPSPLRVLDVRLLG